MTTPKNPSDPDELIAASTQLDSSDWRDNDDEDNYVVARLYKAPDGTFFRFIESSGMNSSYSGAGKFVEWLDAKIEKRTDMYMSTLRSHIEAMGGKLDVIAWFPDGSVKIKNFTDLGTGTPIGS